MGKEKRHNWEGRTTTLAFGWRKDVVSERYSASGIWFSNSQAIDIQFRSNCNNLLYPSELLFIAEYLIEKSSRTDIDLKTSFNTLFEKLRVANIATVAADIITAPKTEEIIIH